MSDIANKNTDIGSDWKAAVAQLRCAQHGTPAPRVTVTSDDGHLDVSLEPTCCMGFTELVEARVKQSIRKGQR